MRRLVTWSGCALVGLWAAACSSTARGTGPTPTGATDPNDVRPKEPLGDDAGTAPPPVPVNGTPAAFTVAGIPFHRASTALGRVNSLWGASASDVWGVGDGNAIVHYDGTQWSYFRKPDEHRDPRSFGLGAVFGTSPLHIWAVGVDSEKAEVVRWTGSDWQPPPVPLAALGTSLYANAVWCSGDDDVWIAGASRSSGSQLIRFHNGAWEKLAVSGTGLLSIWGVDPTHVWMGGENTIVAYDGTTFTASPIGVLADVTAFAGTSAEDVWAFGTAGLARHWNGTSWTTTPMGAPLKFWGAFARASNDVYAVGEWPDVGSAIAHWDGTAWTRAQVKEGAMLTSVWADRSTGVVWIAGDNVLYSGK